MGKMKAWRKPKKQEGVSNRTRKQVMRTFQKQYGVSHLVLKLMLRNGLVDYENYARIMGIKL